MRDLEALLGQIADAAVQTIPAVDAGSISMTEHGHTETRHPTTGTISELDRTQSDLDEGPCITAIGDPPESGLVVAQDFAAAAVLRRRAGPPPAARGRQPRPHRATENTVASRARPDDDAG